MTIFSRRLRVRRQESGDYFYLFFLFPTPYTPHPTPHFPITPLPHHPTPHTPHPTPYTLFQVSGQEITAF
ncbi:DNA gyrase subunit A [Microcystis aeruginosa NIES-98]|nr:DNA gyrase subunit A [Microcystis aeruginosa NIES-98]